MSSCKILARRSANSKTNRDFLQFSRLRVSKRIFQYQAGFPVNPIYSSSSARKSRYTR